MNEKCGKLVKLLAKILFRLLEIAAVVGGVIEMINVNFWVGLGVIVGGSFMAFLSGLVSYCFGEVVDSLISMDITTTEMYHMMQSVEQKSEKN